MGPHCFTTQAQQTGEMEMKVEGVEGPKEHDQRLHPSGTWARNDDELLAFEYLYWAFWRKVLDSSKRVFYKRSCFRRAEAGRLL
jgi:hypothetical protein